ncbi:MAG: hemophore-related protein [Mycobacterium sp.]|jgi:hemophore-related protein
MTSTHRFRSAVVAGALMTAVGLSAGAGVASADPITAALAATTCSYTQFSAALNAQAPDLAVMLSNRPQMQTRLQQLLALPLDQRQQRITEEQAANPQMQQLVAAAIGPQGVQELTQVYSTCQNY